LARLNTQSDALRRLHVTEIMTKKNLLPVLFALGLAVVYAVWFTDWFQPKVVQISHTNRNLHPNRQRGNSLPNLMFRVNRQIRFTELKVVPLAVYETNKDALPVWHLVSDSNSVPVQTFYYGEWIGGMRPAVAGVRAGPLETNVTYRMFVAAGRTKGQHDFELR
jgi:hypothetical protein